MILLINPVVISLVISFNLSGPIIDRIELRKANTIAISIKGIKPETMMHALAEADIYISTKTACSFDNSMSLSVYELTKNKDLASTSIRISLSYLTTKEEINYFLKNFKEKIKELNIK